MESKTEGITFGVNIDADKDCLLKKRREEEWRKRETEQIWLLRI